MPDKWILTFSDKDLLSADMLARLDQPDQKCNLVAVRESQAALQQMEQRPFDLIIVADQGTATSGLTFLERVRSNYHGSHLLYQAGSDDAETLKKATSLNILRALPGPTDEQALMQSINEVLNAGRQDQAGISILDEDDYHRVTSILQLLERDVNARSVVLTNREGTIVAHTRLVERISISRLSFLLSGSIATLGEAGAEVDAGGSTVNLAFSEGETKDLYAVNVGARYLLIILLDRGPSSSRLGLVWYYARAAAVSLAEWLKNAKYVSPENIFGEELDQAISGEFDKMFGGADNVPADRKATKEVPTRPVSDLIARKPDPSSPSAEGTRRPGGTQGSLHNGPIPPGREKSDKI
jgi:DNA-binding NarL/FixJ family response regulator